MSDSEFIELEYLEMHPDVRAAVEDGRFTCGLAHYRKFGEKEGRLPNKKNFLSRQDKVLFGVNRCGLGLEIGPSHNPIAPKREGFNVHILDVDSQEGLRRKYQGHGVNIDNIEAVDYVWSGQPLTELVGKSHCYDYIIASHVIEHVPDLITFLKECEQLLRNDGILTLVIPDKRYCFDYFSSLTTTGDVIDAWICGRKKPSSGQIFNYYANSSKRDSGISWANDGRGGATNLIYEFCEAIDYFYSSLNSKAYVDVHCWKFVPDSFKLIISDLNELNLINFGIIKEFDVAGCEFYISLSKSVDSFFCGERYEILKKILDN